MIEWAGHAGGVEGLQETVSSGDERMEIDWLTGDGSVG